MVTLRGFSAFVEVQVDGEWKKAEEYKPTNPTVSTASCFIESRAGCRYRLIWNEDTKAHGVTGPDWAAEVLVDGTQILCQAISREYPHNRPVTVNGKSMGLTQVLPFVFAKLALTDQDELATQSEQVVKGIGTIAVMFYRCLLGKVVARIPHDTAPVKHTLHERAKKASLDHSTSYGESQAESSTSTSREATWIDPVGKPCLTLEFSYRSGDLLEADGIKPASEPAPAAAANPLAAEDRESTGTPGPASTALKRKTTASGSAVDLTQDAPKRVKQEKKPTTSSTKGKIIDIDDSDDDSELVRLRNEVALLRRKAKQEPGTSKGGIIDISD